MERLVPTMNHVNLDAQDEAVQRFVMLLTVGTAGAILEKGGKPIACLVPPPKAASFSMDNWSREKNERRCALIDKKYGDRLDSADEAELALLQDEAIRYRQRVAPLPMDHARKLHQELLELAASKQTAS